MLESPAKSDYTPLDSAERLADYAIQHADSIASPKKNHRILLSGKLQRSLINGIWEEVCSEKCLLLVLFRQ